MSAPGPAEARSDGSAAPEVERERKRKRRRHLVRVARRKLGAVLLPLAAPSLMRALSGSWRLDELHRERYEGVMRVHGRIVTMWHGRMLAAMREHRGEGHRVLVSPSDDGSLVVPLLRRFGYGVIRGSTNKSPARALREMLGALREGGTIVVTPDGPRGPLHGFNDGPAWMSKATGFPVLPVGIACDRGWHLRSWDRFLIPKPRARVVIVFGEPLVVPRSADDAALSEASGVLRQRMLDAEREGFEHVGAEPDW